MSKPASFIRTAIIVDHSSVFSGFSHILTFLIKNRDGKRAGFSTNSETGSNPKEEIRLKPALNQGINPAEEAGILKGEREYLCAEISPSLPP